MITPINAILLPSGPLTPNPMTKWDIFGTDLKAHATEKKLHACMRVTITKIGVLTKPSVASVLLLIDSDL